jgi:arylsulfatase A
VPLPDVKLDGRSLLPIIKSAEAPTHHKAMHWQWQRFWAVRGGDWKLVGNDAKPSHLGKLSDTEPEKKNHLEDQPEVAKRLLELHNEWLKV